jgi:copper chaperone
MKRILALENIKCDGCSTSIKVSLLKIPDVKSAEVSSEDGTVTIEYSGGENIWSRIVDQLHSMGYVKPGEGSILSSAKSYVSCAIGKLKS